MTDARLPKGELASVPQQLGEAVQGTRALRPTETTVSDAPPGVPGVPGVPTLKIQLLGRVELRVDGREIHVGSRAAQALIALLALTPRIRAREAVAADLWPESEGGGVAASMRQALWHLRSAFLSAGCTLDDYVRIEPDVVGLRPDGPIDVDVNRFETCLRWRPSQPEEALLLYRGDLVEGLGLECLTAERERLSDDYEDALALVAQQRFEAGDSAGARQAALDLLGRDPLREDGHSTLLRVLGRDGARSHVVRQYRRLVELLDRELGVEPLPETAAAYRAALADTVDQSRRRALRAALAAVGGRSGLGVVARG